MKKGFKIAGAIAGLAALAALAPYSVNKDEDGKTTVYALLWKYTGKPDPENPNKRTHILDLGFHNPMDEDNEDLLMDDCDEPILDCTPIASEEPPSTEEEPAPAEEEPVVTEGDCISF